MFMTGLVRKLPHDSSAGPGEDSEAGLSRTVELQCFLERVCRVCHLVLVFGRRRPGFTALPFFHRQLGSS